MEPKIYLSENHKIIVPDPAWQVCYVISHKEFILLRQNSDKPRIRHVV